MNTWNIRHCSSGPRRQFINNEKIIDQRKFCWFGRRWHTPKQPRYISWCPALDLLCNSLCGPRTRKCGSVNSSVVKCPPLNWKFRCSIHDLWVHCRSDPWARAFTSTAPAKSTIQVSTCPQSLSSKSWKKVLATPAISQPRMETNDLWWIVCNGKVLVRRYTVCNRNWSWAKISPLVCKLASLHYGKWS